MKRNREGGMVLTQSEESALARVLIQEAIDNWAEDGWQFVPELAEGQYHSVVAKMRSLVQVSGKGHDVRRAVS